MRNLKRKGRSEEGLVSVYVTTIRPIVENASVVWHPMLTVNQTMLLERQQTQALRNIFGEGLSARKMQERASIQPLHTRKVNACYKFAYKCRTSEKFQSWFPEMKRQDMVEDRGSFTTNMKKCR